MKTIKKLLSIAMVLALVLSLGVSAFAANVTIEDPNGHSYVAYKIFSGTQEATEDDMQLGQVEWAEGVNGNAILTALQADETVGAKFANTTEKPVKTAADVAGVIAGLSEAELRAVGKVLLANKASLGAGIPLVSGTTDLAIGYYFIEDTTNVAGKQDAKNDIILQVTRDVTVTAKYDVPSSEKKVQDVNDSTGDATDWQDSADYDIGDDVPYEIRAVLKDKNYVNYTAYELSIVDEMSKGLTYTPNSAKITWKDADGTEHDITSSFIESIAAGTDGGSTVTWTCSNIKEIDPAIPAGTTIYVNYTAELNENAVIGAKGNPNTSHIEFSNNPYDGGKGQTPDDTVIVFTYDLDVNKVGPDGKEPLEGAAFALYKKVAAGTDGAVALDEKGEIDEDGADKIWLPVTLEEQTLEGHDEATTFYGKGLDDGEYKLVETEVPAGYNGIDPLDFTITAEHDAASDDPTLKSLTMPEGFDIELEPADGAMVDTNITNMSGLELPETGGIGTTIFYVVGAILVAGAVVLLVTKKRMTGTEK